MPFCRAVCALLAGDLGQPGERGVMRRGGGYVGSAVWCNELGGFAVTYDCIIRRNGSIGFFTFHFSLFILYYSYFIYFAMSEKMCKFALNLGLLRPLAHIY